MKLRCFALPRAVAGVLFWSLCALGASAAPVGDFEDHGDVGGPAKPGSASYDAATKTYTITGSGANMWAKADAFHFAWKRVSGDVSLSADIRWPEPGKNPHRKACLIVRQSLDADAPYADAAVHGVGLTSLQCRESAGDTTYEVQSAVSGPARVRIEKQGDVVFISVAGPGEPLRHSGGTFKLKLADPYYVGLGVCAHDDTVLERAEFANVELKNEKFVPADKPLTESTLEVIEIGSKDRRAVHWAAGRFEAPNWTGDGRHFVFNSEGKIYRLPVEGGKPEPVETGEAAKCNNDHGFSPDGSQMAVSSGPGPSRIFIVPAAGGAARLVTPAGPSYWHGWSPDASTLVYCAQRSGEFDVYSIPAAGGEEKRLTTAPGLDDGPEYSPDGQWVYFNSARTGTMQVWRMKPDGSGQEQVTRDEFNNWFPHLSPDGKWIAFVSFDASVPAGEHPPNKDVQLRLMPAAGGPIQLLAKVFGGQGTMNVNSWSPDSKRLAFVSYQLVNP